MLLQSPALRWRREIYYCRARVDTLARLPASSLLCSTRSLYAHAYRYIRYTWAVTGKLGSGGTLPVILLQIHHLDVEQDSIRLTSSKERVPRIIVAVDHPHRMLIFARI